MDIDLIRARLAAQPDQVPAEAIAAPSRTDAAEGLAPRPLVPAAVLVAVVHAPGPGILLTKRTATLTAHAGQVAFPGGRIDPGDASPEAAALREAQEEIGLDPATPELLGRLPDYDTGTGFRITPILALLAQADPARFTPNPAEVDAIFVLPLATLLDPAAPERRRAEFRGRMREFWVWPHEQHYIWGATAGILVHLARRLRDQAREAA